MFLDEVGEMSLRMQALLLRFLETGEIQTVGASAGHAPVDVRVITATNRDLLEASMAREFREDLYYRLNVFQIKIPPLRERAADIPLLVDHYLQYFAEQHKQDPLVLCAPAEGLVACGWPAASANCATSWASRAPRPGPIIEPAALPAEIFHSPAAPRRPELTVHQARCRDHRSAAGAEGIVLTTAYATFMARDITRDDVR